MTNNIKKTRNSKPRIDLTNKKFGLLTPINYLKGGKWICKCECGTECIVDTRNLNSGHTQSCGCLQKKQASHNTFDMIGYENDTIKVLERAGSDNQQIALWKCLCKQCGNIFITRGSTIRNGRTTSCGCIHSKNEQKIIQLLSENNVEFATQYTFSDLKGEKGGFLRFDFAIFKNGKLSHLIEYNGLQHYEKPLGSWSNEFEDLIINDQKKIQYCKDKDIELRIIKYNDKYTINDLI